MSTPARGNSGLIFTLARYVAGVPGAAVAYDDDVKAIAIESEDSDDADLTFAEAAAGATKDFTIVTTATQDTETGGLWRELWDNPGATYDFVYGPHGNAVPTAAKPHFTGTVSATGQPKIGGEASRDKKRFDFEYTFNVDDGPLLDDGA